MQLVKELRELDRRFTRHELSLQSQNFINNLLRTHTAERHCLLPSQHKANPCNDDLQKTVLNFIKQMTCFNLELHLLVKNLPKGMMEIIYTFRNVTKRNVTFPSLFCISESQVLLDFGTNRQKHYCKTPNEFSR